MWPKTGAPRVHRRRAHRACQVVRCHLVIDDLGFIVQVDCSDPDLWGAWEPRKNDSLSAYLGLWDASAAAAVEKARTERRSVSSQFVARTGSGFYVCTIDYAPGTSAEGGDLWLVLEAESEVSTRQLFEMAFRLEQRASVSQTALSELNQDRDVRQCLSSTLPHLLAGRRHGYRSDIRGA